MRRSLIHGLAVGALLAAVPTLAEGQVLPQLRDPVLQADLLFLADQPREAYEILVGRLQTHPDDYEALWKAARAGTVVGISFDDHQEQNSYLDPALHFARRAVELRPSGMDGLYWRGVAAGRRALNAGPGYAVELAQIVYDDAHALLAADSLHAGAHNMLGKLNFEVMSLSRFERLIARTFMGNEALDDTSWENAEKHLSRAVELAPAFVLYQFDLGALYEKRGRDEEAAMHLREALRLPAARPIDADLQQRAVELLQDIER